GVRRRALQQRQRQRREVRAVAPRFRLLEQRHGGVGAALAQRRETAREAAVGGVEEAALEAAERLRVDGLQLPLDAGEDRERELRRRVVRVREHVAQLADAFGRALLAHEQLRAQ